MFRYVLSLLLMLGVAAVVLLILPADWGGEISDQPRSMEGSGFVNDHADVAPGTWAWSDHLDLRIDHPEETNIVIWNHHTVAMTDAVSCRGSAYFPPPSIMALEKIGRTRVYYLCTKSAQGAGRPHFALQRRDEILTLVRRFRDLGVPPGRIFLSGQSGGSCSSLLALGAAPEEMNAGILFATACFGKGEGLLRTAGRLSAANKAVDAEILAANSVTALLVAFQKDNWNRPQHHAYLTNAWPDTVDLFTPDCGANHSGAFYGCGLDPVAATVQDYFLKRLAARGLVPGEP